ncbi:MAG: inositol monophosphatase [Magnetococcales bacterium]|nr:inositol monophosphatase [Magnetococcales bacterium]
MSPPMNVAVRIARQAGILAREWFDRRHELEIKQKGINDPVTAADLMVEEEIRYHLKKAYPRYGILAEEKGGNLTQERPCWIVDPIDGTLNFAHGLPHFAISIGLIEKNVLQGGVIYDPMRDELFTAERGRGAYLNDRRIRVTRPTEGMTHALLATGFPHRKLHQLPGYLNAFEAFVKMVADQRRQGSAALDLAYVAAGRYDGFWECGLAPWDLAAGVLLVREAGGLVSDFANQEGFLTSGNVIAAPDAIHGAMLEVIRNSGLAG